MRCHICDVILSEPTFNADHGDWDPCEDCKTVIQETLNQFKDRPSLDEDEFPEDSWLDGLDLPIPELQ